MCPCFKDDGVSSPLVLTGQTARLTPNEKLTESKGGSVCRNADVALADLGHPCHYPICVICVITQSVSFESLPEMCYL